ncbi:carbohydrate sulfotransferase 15-like [Littorina saxatilis]|uniref:carbohydrate sulfotransferase 15-like n=1 Tax=Littorina saxatilis TaxID=31220 RepID=UPI0038B47860
MRQAMQDLREIKPSEKQQQSLESEVLKTRLSALLKSRNPCSQENNARLGLACLPSLYLAGFPKCGTTDLYQRVTAHPHIASSPHKVLHWITRRRFASKTYLKKNIAHYYMFFCLCGTALEDYKGLFGEVLLRSSPIGGNWSSLIVGDHSSSTLWDNRHWQRLPGNENCSVPRVITADRLGATFESLYSEYMFFNGNATKKEFHSQVAKDTQRTTDCFLRKSVRWCIYNVLQEMTLRLHVGLYAVYIEDWLKRFPRDQLHVLRLEDLALNPYKEVTAVHTFPDLEKADDEATLETVVNPQVSNAGYRSHQAGPMLPKTRAMLDTFYRPFNTRLTQVLRKEKYQWADV